MQPGGNRGSARREDGRRISYSYLSIATVVVVVVVVVLCVCKGRKRKCEKHECTYSYM